MESDLVKSYRYSATFDVELAFLEASDWATQKQLFKGVTAVGKIHAFYDEKGNRIPV
ncbi:hypothetical protein ACIQXG_01045 [Lysinibacillus sphaericus]|uniref:hypothetical protein n=1 Tax=Lysinibacillus sphaericus TaxID=1421 RepID=UPI0037F8EA55